MSNSCNQSFDSVIFHGIFVHISRWTLKKNDRMASFSPCYTTFSFPLSIFSFSLCIQKRFSLPTMRTRKLLGIRIIMCKYKHRQLIAKVKMITTIANFISVEETSLSHNDTTYRNRTHSLWVVNFWHAFSAFIAYNKL